MNNIAPPRFHVLAKPTGAICNLAQFTFKEMINV